MRQHYDSEAYSKKYIKHHREIIHGELFTIHDMEHEAATIKTFDGEIYVKLGGGEYVLKNAPAITVPASKVYRNAKTIMNSHRKLIAKRLMLPSDYIEFMMKKDKSYRPSNFVLRRVRMKYRPYTSNSPYVEDRLLK